MHVEEVNIAELFARGWAERYGEIARSYVAAGNASEAYHFAMLAAHKAAFILPDDLPLAPVLPLAPR